MKTSQHTVSRFYLSQFTPAQGQRVLWAYEKGNAYRPAQRSPKNCSCEDHFYAMEGPNGSFDNSLEDALSEIERLCAPAIRRISRNQSVTMEDRKWVSYFIAMLFLRIKGMRDHAEHQKLGIESAEGTIRWVEARRLDLEKRFGREIVEDFLCGVAKRGQGVTMKRNFHLNGFFQRARKFAEVIVEMDWTVNLCKSGEFFVTSDNPAFVRRPTHLRDSGVVGINRADLNAELGFPLSRRSFLLAKWGRGSGLRSISAAKLRVRELNTRTVLSAHRFVYSPERNDVIANLVKENEDFRLTYPAMPV